ncbi:hypothetical protein ACFWVB_26960 [Streptomyces microflavus]|uniref:hypothetical protein n=1 Tax=Streptomyces microflavus TaxID=1919 RepID=UPI00344326DC
MWGNIFGCVLFGACLVWGTVNPPVEGVWWWLGLIGVVSAFLSSGRGACLAHQEKAAASA